MQLHWHTVMLRVLGITWAMPLTLFALCSILPFWVQRKIKLFGFRDNSLVWCITDPKTRRFLAHNRSTSNGIVIGNVSILIDDPDKMDAMIVRYVNAKTLQFMKLGVFRPVFTVTHRILAHNLGTLHSHYDNPLEVDARRAAGFMLDIGGAFYNGRVNGRKKAKEAVKVDKEEARDATI